MGTPKACSAINAAVFHQAIPRSLRALAPKPSGMTLRLSPKQVRSGGKPAAATGALALNRRSTSPPVSVVELISRPDMFSTKFIAALARSEDVKPGTLGTGIVSPAPTGSPTPASVSSSIPLVHNERVSSPRSMPRPNGTSPTSSIGRNGDAGLTPDSPRRGALQVPRLLCVTYRLSK